MLNKATREALLFDPENWDGYEEDPYVPESAYYSGFYGIRSYGLCGFHAKESKIDKRLSAYWRKITKARRKEEVVKDYMARYRGIITYTCNLPPKGHYL